MIESIVAFEGCRMTRPEFKRWLVRGPSGIGMGGEYIVAKRSCLEIAQFSGILVVSCVRHWLTYQSFG